MKHIPINTKYLINEDGTRIINEVTGRGLKTRKQLRKGKETGYVYCTLLSEDGEYKWKGYSVHRLVALTYLEPPIEGQVWVNHKDGNKANNHWSNLEWTTISENIQHAFDTGLKVAKKGENSPLYGTKHSLKTKAKMSVSKQGENHPKFKGYYYVFFKQYGSAGEASRATGINARTIYDKCMKQQKPDFYFIPKANL